MKTNKFFIGIISIFISVLLLTVPIFANINTKMEDFVKKEKFVDAEKYCEKQKEPKKTEYYNILADICFEHTYYENAAKYYERIDNKEGLKKVADIYFSKSDYEKAIPLYIKAGENELVVYNKAADDAFIKGEYEIAAQYYEKASNKEGLKKIADIYLSKSDYEKAISLYIKAGEVELTVYNKVADDAKANSKYEIAASYYEKAGNKEGLKKVADIYLNNKDYDKAVDLYLKAGENDKAIFNKIADDAFANKNYDKAAEYYEKSGENEKTVYTKIADNAFYNKDYDYAAEYYEKAGNKAGLKKLQTIINKDYYSTAHSDWVYIKSGAVSNIGCNIYFNKNSIVRNGNIIYYWELRVLDYLDYAGNSKYIFKNKISIDTHEVDYLYMNSYNNDRLVWQTPLGAASGKSYINSKEYVFLLLNAKEGQDIGMIPPNPFPL